MEVGGGAQRRRRWAAAGSSAAVLAVAAALCILLAGEDDRGLLSSVVGEGSKTALLSFFQGRGGEGQSPGLFGSIAPGQGMFQGGKLYGAVAQAGQYRVMAAPLAQQPQMVMQQQHLLQPMAAAVPLVAAGMQQQPSMFPGQTTMVKPQGWPMVQQAPTLVRLHQPMARNVGGMMVLPGGGIPTYAGLVQQQPLQPIMIHRTITRTIPAPEPAPVPTPAPEEDGKIKEMHDAVKRMKAISSGEYKALAKKLRKLDDTLEDAVEKDQPAPETSPKPPAEVEDDIKEAEEDQVEDKDLESYEWQEPQTPPPTPAPTPPPTPAPTPAPTPSPTPAPTPSPTPAPAPPAPAPAPPRREEGAPPPPPPPPAASSRHETYEVPRDNRRYRDRDQYLFYNSVGWDGSPDKGDPDAVSGPPKHWRTDARKEDTECNDKGDFSRDEDKWHPPHTWTRTGRGSVGGDAKPVWKGSYFGGVRRYGHAFSPVKKAGGAALRGEDERGGGGESDSRDGHEGEKEDGDVPGNGEGGQQQKDGHGRNDDEAVASVSNDSGPSREDARSSGRGQVDSRAEGGAGDEGRDDDGGSERARVYDGRDGADPGVGAAARWRRLKDSGCRGDDCGEKEMRRAGVEPPHEGDGDGREDHASWNRVESRADEEGRVEGGKGPGRHSNEPPLFDESNMYWDDRKKSDPHGMWGKWRNDPLGMPKGRLQSGLKGRNRQQELEGARRRLEQAHAQILAMGREGGDEESRGHGGGGGGGGRGGWVRRPESARPLESMMSGYNLAGGAHPGRDLSRSRDQYVVESLARLTRKHSGHDDSFVVDSSEKTPGNWHPSSSLTHFMTHQNSLKSFA